MRALQDVALALGIEARELEAWIERHWVLAVFEQGDWRLSETDIARVRMIAELSRDLAIDDEAMPVVLGLLDQVHTLRRQLRRLAAALSTLPEPERRAVVERLTGINFGETP